MKVQDANQKLAQEQLKELEGMLPELPRFEGFFKSMNRDEHPFEGEEYQYKNQMDADSLKAEEEFDEELLQRELEGRLLGETLTPRQFGILYKAKVE